MAEDIIEFEPAEVVAEPTAKPDAEAGPAQLTREDLAAFGQNLAKEIAAAKKRSQRCSQRSHVARPPGSFFEEVGLWMGLDG